MTTAYLLTSTISVPVFAKLSDLYGRKWLYLVGLTIFVVSSWLCGAAGNIPLPLDGMNQLILFRGLQGIGGGAVMGLTFTIIGDLFSPAERGRYQGMFGAVFGLASIVGPLAGGFITDHLSWRWAFYVNAPLGIVALVVLYRTFPFVRPHGSTHTIDWLGLVTLSGWIVPLLLALSRVTAAGWTDATVRAAARAGAGSLVAFLWVERRAVEPLMPLSLFAIRTIALVSAGVFVLGMSMFGMFVYLPLYLQGVLGMSAAASGTLFVPMIFAMILASVASGQIVVADRPLQVPRRRRCGDGHGGHGAAGAARPVGHGDDDSVVPGRVRLRLRRCPAGLRAGGAERGAAGATRGGHGHQPVLPLDRQHHRRGRVRHGAPGHLPPAAGVGAAGRHAAAGACDRRQPADDEPQRGGGRAAAHLPPMDAAVASAVRSSLAAGMQRIFDLAAVVMATSVLLNAWLPELPLRSRAEHASPADAL